MLLKFRAAVNFYSDFVFRTRSICVRNVMEVILAFFWQFKFRCLLISSLHGAFSLFTNAYAQNIESQKLLLRKSQESFDTGTVKKQRTFQYW